MAMGPMPFSHRCFYHGFRCRPGNHHFNDYRLGPIELSKMPYETAFMELTFMLKNFSSIPLSLTAGLIAFYWSLSLYKTNLKKEVKLYVEKIYWIDFDKMEQFMVDVFKAVGVPEKTQRSVLMFLLLPIKGH